MLSNYERIQSILNFSTNPIKELKIIFASWGKDYLFNFIKPLNFGADQELINSLITEICIVENIKLKNKKFDSELSQYIKSLPTRKLLKMLKTQRCNKDELFYCIKKELLTREHIPNKIESKEIRKSKAKKKITKLEKRQKKLKTDVLKLREKGLTISTIARKLKMTSKEVLYFLKEAGLEDKIESEIIEIPYQDKELIGYRLNGEPMYDVWDSERDILITKKVIAKNPKHSYSPKFGINSDKLK